jgi:hypothetical protein
MENIEKLRPSEYARRVGVNPSRISFLKSKLNKTMYGSTWFVHVDKDNARLFKKSGLGAYGKVLIKDRSDIKEIEISDIKDKTIQNYIKIVGIIKSKYGREFPIIVKTSCFGGKINVTLKKKL